VVVALTRTSTDVTYKSSAGGEDYYFIVVMDQQSNVSVRNIRSPTGLIVDANTTVPKDVQTDMATAIGQVEDLVAQTSAVNGNLVYAAEVTKAVVFATAMANTNYRVVFSTTDFIAVRVTNKATTGFTVETNVTYTGTVGYDVFV